MPRNTRSSVEITCGKFICSRRGRRPDVPKIITSDGVVGDGASTSRITETKKSYSMAEFSLHQVDLRSQLNKNNVKIVKMTKFFDYFYK